MTLILALALLGIPCLYLVVLVRLLVRVDRKGIGLSLLWFATAVTTGLWAIAQSLSSTAGIAVIGIPLMGAVAGFLGLAFGRWRASSEPIRKIAAWVGLAGTLLLVSYNIAQGNKTRAKNRVIDVKQVAYMAGLARARDTVAAGLSQNRGHEQAWLDSSIRARTNDRAFVLAALRTDSISSGLLDTLANSPDLGIVLEALRNPNARAETLERVYRTRTYPGYFFQVLVSHRNTPPAVLREIYRGPHAVPGLDIWFAGNPSAPREILDDIARTSGDKSIIGTLLANPSLDCGLLTEIAANLRKGEKPDANDPNAIRVAYLDPTLCPKKTTR